MLRRLLLVLMVTTTVWVSAMARTIHLQPAISSNAGLTNPASVAVGDFNCDGLTDLVVTNHFDSVSILLGLGDGTFSQPSVYTLDFYVENQVGVADFNQDGIQDLLIIGGSQDVSATFAIMLGNGDGSFAAPTYYSTTHDGSVISLAMGDLNHDGIMDFVFGGNGSSLVVLGTPGGGFQEGEYLPSSGFAVAEGDLNGDGNLDAVLVADIYSSYSVFLGDGHGKFHKPATFADNLEPIGVMLGDFNRDGRLDLAIANFNAVSVDVFLGNGDGTFGTGVFWLCGTAPAAVVTADFNKDGNLDLATANNSSNNVGVLGGRGDGTFTHPQFVSTGSGPTFLATGDFNHDGSTDLVTTNSGDNTISVILNSAGTLVALTSSLNPSLVGQSVTFTATVQGSVLASIPGGSVTFRDGPTVLARSPLSNGVAAVTTSSLTQGSHRITASYSGDGTFNPNQSSVLVQVVN